MRKHMKREGIEDGETSIPLILRENPDDGGSSSSSATAVVVLSTLVAVFGSFVFGSAVSYNLTSFLVHFGFDNNF